MSRLVPNPLFGLLFGLQMFLNPFSQCLSQISPSATKLSTGVAAEVPAEDLLPLMIAHAQFESKNYSAALEGFRKFLSKHGNAEKTNADVVKAYNAMATCLMMQNEFSQAIDALNRLDQWVNDFSIPFRRGRCYHKLHQDQPAVDELRRAAMMSPDNPIPRIELALILATTEDMEVHDGHEALDILRGFENLIEEVPSIAMALATAAAVTGNFDDAIKMQERYIALQNDPEDSEFAKFILSTYRRRQNPHPLFTRTLSPGREDKRKRTLEQSTVLVRVRGRVSHYLLDQGACEVESIERDHVGSVLDAKGLILVSGSSIGISPYTDQGKRPNQDSTWINGPFIEVFSIAKNNSKPVLIGHAEIVGLDRETNVGVVRIKNSDPIEPIPSLQSITFQPASLANSADSNNPCYISELKGGLTVAHSPDDALTLSTLTNAREITAVSSVIAPVSVDQRAFLLHRQDKANDSSVQLSKFVVAQNAKWRIGQPIINAEGECVAITSSIIDGDGNERIVGIPATVLSRVSSKLISYGQVDRIQLPLRVAPVAKRVKSEGKERIVAGMQITKVLSNDETYTGLEGHVILSIDGMPLSSNTRYLIATERAFCLGKKTVRCEVTKSPGDIVRTLDLPFTR